MYSALCLSRCYDWSTKSRPAGFRGGTSRVRVAFWPGAEIGHDNFPKIISQPRNQSLACAAETKSLSHRIYELYDGRSSSCAWLGR